LVLQTPDSSIIKFYDVLGEMYDWFSAFEARVKKAAFDWLALSPGENVLNIGIGSGKDHSLGELPEKSVEIIQNACKIP
jgi:ubiquinone/menaquinone biosynthesis C-methylase UbiE